MHWSVGLHNGCFFIFSNVSVVFMSMHFVLMMKCSLIVKNNPITYGSVNTYWLMYMVYWDFESTMRAG